MDTRFDKVFKVSIILKGLDSLLEVVGGIFLLIVKPSTLHSWANQIVKTSFFKQHASLSGYITHSVHNIALATLFGAIYLLVHGAIKLGLVIAILYNKLWAYPVFLVVLLIFIISQVILLMRHLSVGLSLLTVFDVFVTVMTWLEWQKQLALRKEIKESDLN